MSGGICIVDNCEKPRDRKSLRCRMHIDRWQRFGSYEMPPPPTTPPAGVRVQPIPDFPRYFAGDDGNIYSSVKPDRASPGQLRRMRANPNARTGYLGVCMRTPDGRTRTQPVHRLICDGWYGPLNRGMCRRHLDGDKTNNRLSNLAIGTYADNTADMLRHGREVRGLRQHKAWVLDEDVARAVERVRNGESQREVASDLSIGQSTLSGWCRGEHRSRTTETNEPLTYRSRSFARQLGVG